MFIGIGGLRIGGNPTPGGAAPDSTATWNPADKGANVILSDGNLRATASVADWDSVRGTVTANTGKRYFEIVATSGDFARLIMGVAKAAASMSNYLGSDADGWSIQPWSSLKWNAGASAAYAVGSPANGDVFGIFLDLDVGTLAFSRNNTSYGTAYSSLSGTFYPACAVLGPTGNGLARFARSSWSYAQPTWKQWGEA